MLAHAALALFEEGARGNPAGVIDQDVEPPEGVRRLVDRGPQCVRIHHVAGKRQRANTPFGNARRRLFGAFRKDVEDRNRSEEHTSELQSIMRISYAVFCLKKKKTQEINRQKTSKQ